LADSKDLGKLVMGFIFIVLGAVLIASIADEISANTTIGDVVNETIAISSGTGSLAKSDIDSVSYFGNTTMNTGQTEFAVDLGVNWTTAGALTVAGNFTDDNYNVSYLHYPDEYVKDSTSRTLLPLIIIFFALAVLAGGVMLALSGLRGMGIPI